MTDLPYRSAVGIMLLNREGKVFVGQRIDTTLEAWQMPQGGLDKGEDAEAGMFRELEEETGIRRELVEIVHRCREEFTYDIPKDMIGKVWKGKYRGQKQIWFLCRFLGIDADVKLDAHDQEFRAYRWSEPKELPAMIVPFKKQLYNEVLEAFADWL